MAYPLYVPSGPASRTQQALGKFLLSERIWFPNEFTVYSKFYATKEEKTRPE